MKRYLIRLRLALGPLLIGLALLLTSCSVPGVPATSAVLPSVGAPPAAQQLPPVRFPQDEAPHKDLTEWWYYTGHMNATTPEGQTHRYGFELVFFQALRSDYPPVYAAHFAISDITRGQFHYEQRRLTEPNAVIPNGTSSEGVHVAINDWSISGLNGRDHLQASMDGYTISLDLNAPNIYITGNPARDAAVTRAFEQALAKITTANPLSGQTEPLANYLVDPVEMNLLHMITADPARTPTLTMFAKPDYFVQTGAANCNSPCVFESPAFAWNHGDVSPDINVTWLGMVGPGVKELGVDHDVWSDHADIRPTIMELTGLRDDYQHEGRVLFEVITTSALPIAVREHEHQLIELAQIFKQINAPVGALGLETLAISTKALASNSPNDQTYTSLENQLISITQARNVIASQILNLLETAEFGDAGAPHGFHADDSSLNSLSDQGQSLLQQVNDLAS